MRCRLNTSPPLRRKLRAKVWRRRRGAHRQGLAARQAPEDLLKAVRGERAAVGGEEQRVADLGLAGLSVLSIQVGLISELATWRAGLPRRIGLPAPRCEAAIQGSFRHSRHLPT